MMLLSQSGQGVYIAVVEVSPVCIEMVGVVYLVLLYTAYGSGPVSRPFC